MELAELLHQLKRNVRLLSIMGILFSLVGFFIAQFVYPHYQASTQLYLFRPTTTAPAGDFTYDGFYAQQFAEAYTDTAVGFVESNDTIAQALTDIEKDPSELREYRRAVNVQKAAPQLVLIDVSLEDESKARTFALAIANAAIEKINTLNQDKEPNIQVQLVSDEPLVQYRRIPFPVGTLVGLAVGVFLGVSFIFFKSYLKKHE